MRILAALMAATFLGLMLQILAQERHDSTGPAVYKVEFDIRYSSDARPFGTIGATTEGGRACWFRTHRKPFNAERSNGGSAS
jgi:hypothetical protein